MRPRLKRTAGTPVFRAPGLLTALPPRTGRPRLRQWPPSRQAKRPTAFRVSSSSSARAFLGSTPQPGAMPRTRGSSMCSCCPSHLSLPAPGVHVVWTSQDGPKTNSATTRQHTTNTTDPTPSASRSCARIPTSTAQAPARATSVPATTISSGCIPSAPPSVWSITSPIMQESLELAPLPPRESVGVVRVTQLAALIRLT